MTHTEQFLKETIAIAESLDANKVEEMVKELVSLRERKGRLFIIGIGGSAANASHAVNDFRKLCNIEALSPVDNVAELTARINDEGWDTCFKDWLEGSQADANDVVLVLSVGGGTDRVSTPLTFAVRWFYGKTLGIVGPNGGMTKKYGHTVINVPLVNPERITPHTEGWQSVILHAIVSHPDLQQRKTKW